MKAAACAECGEPGWNCCFGLHEAASRVGTTLVRVGVATPHHASQIAPIVVLPSGQALQATKQAPPLCTLLYHPLAPPPQPRIAAMQLTVTARAPQAAMQPRGAAGRRGAALLPPAVARPARAAARTPAAQRPAPRHLQCQAAAASEAGQPPLAIPRGPQETVQQALAACTRAWEAGQRRQRVELLLPLIGATDLDDW